jgi:RES domain-containing protein
VTPLPAALGGGRLVAWRLDIAPYGSSWDSGEGAFRAGGRWNSKGVRCGSIDPATAILEVAVPKGFETLDIVTHVLTAFTIDEPASVHVVQPDEVLNPNWLVPGIPGAGQQAFGDTLLARHKFVVLPSVVSWHSWNLLLVASNAAGAYRLTSQERFALETRLNPAKRQEPRPQQHH